jgi:hypothetical protein
VPVLVLVLVVVTGASLHDRKGLVLLATVELC